MRWALLIVAAACNSKPRAVEPLPKPNANLGARRLAHVPRPTIVLPKLALHPVITGTIEPEDLKWPLVREPTAEPHAPLDAIFRSTGPWRDLCSARSEPRWVDRDEALAYLGAWCAHSDAAAIRQRLIPLAKAKSPKIANAARADLVDLLATDARIDPIALGSLDVRGLGDLVDLDALAASYQALDKPEHATVIVKSIRGRRIPTRVEDHCRRLLRDHLITERDVVFELQRHASDPTCARIEVYVTDRPSRCPLDTRHWSPTTCSKAACADLDDLLIKKCAGRVPSRPDDNPIIARLHAAYESWPMLPEPKVWLDYARFLHELDLPEATTLEIAALENASLFADCAKEVDAVVALAQAVKPHAPEHPVLAHLVALTQASCAKRFSPTLDAKRR